MSEQGKVIAGRYELVASIGRGGMGIVWRARDTRLGRAVAIKLLPASSLGNEGARARLIREARAAAALEHPSIIRVYDVGELDDGGTYLVMELVRGRTLRELLDDGAPEGGRSVLPPGRAGRIVAAVARALHFAHSAGVVHRDVKPDNVMIRDDGTVIVVDFGVAKPVATDLTVNAETLAGVTGTSLTMEGQLVGTPAYFSPEQARGAPIDGATDQFALAVTAFEVLTGALPWSGKTVVEVVAAILRDPPPSLVAEVPDAPPALEAALVRALAKDPRDRFADAEAFADAVTEAVAALPEGLPARPTRSITAPHDAPPRVVAAHSADGVRVTTNGGQTATSEASGGRGKLGRALAIGAIGVALVGGFVIWRGPRTPALGVGVASELPDVTACPPFDVDPALDAPWLGAAAASLACERFQIARGGLDARTLVPAELLDLPREIGPAFPRQPFDAPESRAKALAAATRRAARVVDGRVEKRPDGYVVKLTLTSGGASRDGAPILATGEGHGIELFEAVRGAVKPLLPLAGGPTAAERAALVEWFDVGSVDDALALLDVRTAILIEDTHSLRAECMAAASRATLSPRTAYLTESACRRRLRTGPMTTPPPPIDASTPGALITTTLAHGSAGGADAVRARALRLDQARDATELPEGKARLSAAAAEIYNLVADERGRGAARAALGASPKGVDPRTNAWHRVAFTSESDTTLSSALMAWQPWEPVSQSFAASSGTIKDPRTMSEAIRRSYLLAQRGTYALGYGGDLLSRGDIEVARGVAERAQDPLLDVLVLSAQARYGAAIGKTEALLRELPADDASAALAFRLAQAGVTASLVLDRPATFVEPVVDRYVMSDPPHVIDGIVPVVALVHACALAPKAVGRRCLDRLEQLRSERRLPTIFTNLETILAGARRFVADDFVGAAKAWRTLLRSPGWVQGPLREALAIAFDRANEPELADEVDAPTVALVDLPRTADLAWVRAARRAARRGDAAKARKLAEAVVDKWRFADEDIPATREMKDLLVKLR